MTGLIILSQSSCSCYSYSFMIDMKKASNENANRPLALWFTVIWWVFFVYMLAYILYLHKVHVACSYVMYFLFGLAIGSHITNNLQNK